MSACPTIPQRLRSPYPWFGGKSKVAPIVWERFGDVRNYVEPFLGSAAMLLLRPQPFEGIETVNDLDGFISNFWRALKAAPDAVAEHADWPVNENDLHARHVWLVGKKDGLQAQLEGDPDFYDAKIAGWWVWGIACWIGSGFCSGDGPWQSVVGEDGSRKLVHLGNAGQGVKRQLVHLGDAGQGGKRQRVHLGDAGRGVNRQLVHLGDAGLGVNRKRAEELTEYFAALADRLARVRVCCGDWSRVLGPTPTVKQGLTAVFLDPPYSSESRDQDLYVQESLTLAHDVRAWCLEHGHDDRLRIALCGYEGEHEELERHGWDVVAWKAHGGYGAGKGGAGDQNKHLERIWFSPHCLRPEHGPGRLKLCFD